MYSIGQILWVIGKTIEPIQVVSKTTTEDQSGCITQHNARNPRGDTFCVERLKTDVFGSIEEAESHLLMRATSQIKKMASNAKTAAVAFQPVVKPEPVAIEDEQDWPMIDLPDGTKARVRISNDLGTATS